MTDSPGGALSQVELVETQTPYGRFSSVAGDHISQQLQQYGAHTRNELAMLLSFIRPGDTVVDVGAHIGSFAIPMARKGAAVFAFEPLPLLHSLLRRNISLNDLEHSITSYEAVVGNNDDPYRAAGIEVEDTGKTKYIPGDDIAGVILDEWWDERGRPKIDVLKVDVEGMDYEVLDGARRLVSASRPLVYVEIHRKRLGNSNVKAIEKLLRDNGYVFFRNVAARNSSLDDFRVSRVPNLLLGGGFFDLLAIPRQSDRYPAKSGSSLRTLGMVGLRRLPSWMQRLVRPERSSS